MSSTLNMFLSLIADQHPGIDNSNLTILDLGCGSGRDTKTFLSKGFQVEAVDGSEEMCKIAEKNTGHPVILSSFQNYLPTIKFDGIWACSSLLHLNKEEIHDVVQKLSTFMNPGACFYMSYKYGDFTGYRNGRYYTDFTEDSSKKLFANISQLRFHSLIITNDVRPGRESEKWLNVFYTCR